MELIGAGEGTIFQPWNQVLFPSVDAPRPFGWRQARSIPGLAKAVLLIAGVVRQMPMDDVRRDEVLPRPRILEKPDPDMSRSRLIGLMVEDYLLHGNAIAVVTVRDPSTGWPAAISYVPPRHVTIEWAKDTGRIVYKVGRRRVPSEDVIHIPRGADPEFPWRGQGVIEQHTDYLGRADDESVYSRSLLKDSGVPSVVIYSPNEELSQDEADAAKQSWVTKFARATREPAVMPKGTQVVPLSWSPHDAQLVEARKLTKNDLADMFGLDGYWLGVETGGLTYKSPAPLYLNLVRQTVEPIVQDIEQPLSDALLPDGEGVRFDRSVVLRDDHAAEIVSMAGAVDAGLYTWEEARQRLGRSADPSLRPSGEDGGKSLSRELAEIVQKIYLGVGKVLTAEEARAILAGAGAVLEPGFVPAVSVNDGEDQ